MKAVFVLASLVLSAFAQSATIAVPAAGSTLVAGSQITIEVDQPVSNLHMYSPPSRSC